MERCFSLLKIKKITVDDNSLIAIKNSDDLIDLSPCIGIYQEAVFFDNYKIESEIELSLLVTYSHHLRSGKLLAQEYQHIQYQRANPVRPTVFTNDVPSVPWIFYAQKEAWFSHIRFLCATRNIQLSMY